MSFRTRFTVGNVAEVMLFASIILLIYLLASSPSLTVLKTDDWRCTTRDVASGQCDVYERRGRDRGDD